MRTKHIDSSIAYLSIEMQPIATEDDWKQAINAAHEVFEKPASKKEASNKKTKPKLQDRLLHVVVLATTYKVKVPAASKRKRKHSKPTSQTTEKAKTNQQLFSIGHRHSSTHSSKVSLVTIPTAPSSLISSLKDVLHAQSIKPFTSATLIMV